MDLSLVTILFVLSISVLLFLIYIAGFYTGLWLARRESVIINKPQVEIVKVPEVKIVEVPTPTVSNRQVKPADKAGPFIMQPNRQTTAERQEQNRLGELLETEPEL